MRQCTICTCTIVPGSGPSLLWAPAGGSEPRQAFHLACWLSRHYDQQLAAVAAER